MIKTKVKVKNLKLLVTVSLPFGKEVDKQRLDFLNRKNTPGFLRVQSMKTRRVVYSGTIGVPLSDRFLAPMTRFDFFMIMGQIVLLVRNLKRERILLEHVCWETTGIFYNRNTKEMQFLFLPNNALACSNVGELVQSILHSSHIDGASNDDFLSRFVYFLRSMPSFDEERVAEYLLQVQPDVCQMLKLSKQGSNNNAHQNRGYDDIQTAPLATYDYEDEVTSLLEDDDNEGTALLMQPNHNYPTLCRVGTNETIAINKPVFRLGKEQSYVDYFVNNNAVSRSHADIITRGSEYYLKDLNSKNKTYLNHTPLTPQKEYLLVEGDQIRLGNEEFVFHKEELGI